MKKNDINKVIQRFNEYCQKGKIAILAGAGISHSHPSHLPLAGQISREFLSQFWKNSTILRGLKLPKEKAAINEDKFLSIFMGKESTELRFEQLMQVIFDTTGELVLSSLFKSNRPNLIHDFLTTAIEKGNQVVTTNFDTLIEKKGLKANEIQVLSTDADFKDARKNIGKLKFLFKIHGSLDHEESMKATLHQVGQSGLAFMWEPGKGRVLEKLQKQYDLLFLGYSGTDDFDVMSKLSITESNKEVLWIKHVDNMEPQLVARELFHMEFKDNFLREFFDTHRAFVIKGDTSIFIVRLANLCFKMDIAEPPEECNCKYKDRFSLVILETVKKWTKENYGLIEFVVARLLYLVNKPLLSLGIFLQLEELFRQIADVQNYARTLLNIAVINEKIGKIDESIKFQEQANMFFLALGDMATYIDSIVNLGVLKMREKDHKEAETLLRRAVAFSRKNKLEVQHAKAISNLASFYWNIGKYDEAQKYSKLAYNKYKKLGDLDGCAVTLSTMGKIAYAKNNDTDLAEALFQMAMEYAIRLRDLDMQSALWNNLGGIYRKQAKLKTAIIAYDKAYALAEQTGNKKSIAVSKMGKVAVELSKGDLNKAIQIGKRCLEEGREVGMLDHVAQTAGNIGLAYLDKKQYSEALKYLKIAMKDFEKLGLPIELAFTYRNIGECLLKMSRKNEAEKMLQKAHTLYKEYGFENLANAAINLLNDYDPNE